MNASQKAWKCTVCGYIHYGEQPPESCPVCGATSDLFDAFETSEIQAGDVQSGEKWRCLNCEFIHSGSAPPDVCPVCGVTEESFEVYSENSSKNNSRGNEKLHILIAGGGIAGISAAEAIRKTDTKIRVTVLSKEGHLPYYRLNLTRYLAGEIDDSQLLLHHKNWYETNRIELMQNSELCSIDKLKKRAALKSGENLSYDKLIMAMGSHSFIPPIPGGNKENVTALRTKDDADFILDKCQQNPSIAVIGGGLLGLEAAGALAKKGLNVTLIEGFGWLLPRQLNERAGRLLESSVQKIGIKLITGTQIKEISGDERARSVLLEDGRSVKAELIIISTGIRSNSYIARLAELEVNRGIVVNNFLESSDSDIFAAGDVAEHHGLSYGTWGPSLFQGTIAGMNACGNRTEFAGIPRSNLLKVLGYDLFSIGQIRGEDASFSSLEYSENESYYFFFFHDSIMVGAILMGDASLSATVKNIIEKRRECSKYIHETDGAESIMSWIRNNADY